MRIRPGALAVGLTLGASLPLGPSPAGDPAAATTPIVGPAFVPPGTGAGEGDGGEAGAGGDGMGWFVPVVSAAAMAGAAATATATVRAGRRRPKHAPTA